MISRLLRILSKKLVTYSFSHYIFIWMLMLQYSFLYIFIRNGNSTYSYNVLLSYLQRWVNRQIKFSDFSLSLSQRFIAGIQSRHSREQFTDTWIMNQHFKVRLGLVCWFSISITDVCTWKLYLLTFTKTSFLREALYCPGLDYYDYFNNER